MGATIRWVDKDKTILYYGLNGNWDQPKFYTTLKTLWQGIASLPHRVDLIIDLRECLLRSDEHEAEADLLPLWCPANLDRAIIIGRTGPIYAVYGAFMWHSKSAYLLVDIRVMSTPEMAYQFLREAHTRGSELA